MVRERRFAYAAGDTVTYSCSDDALAPSPRAHSRRTVYWNCMKIIQHFLSQDRKCLSEKAEEWSRNFLGLF